MCISLRHRLLQLFVERGLAHCDGRRRLRRDCAREVDRGLHHTPGRDNAVQETIFDSLRRRQRLTQQQHLHRSLARHVARERNHRRRAEQADIDTGRRKRRRPGCNGQIAGRHQLTPRRCRNTLDRCDHRLGARHDALHERRTLRHRLGIKRAAAIGVGAVSGQFLEVVTRAERRTIARQHDGLDALIGAERCNCLRQRAHQVSRQRIARLGPVHGHHRDAGLGPGDL